MARPSKHAAAPPATRGRPKTDIPPARAAARIMQLEHDLADAAARLSALATENVSIAARSSELERRIADDGWTIYDLRHRLRESEARRQVCEGQIELLNGALAEAGIVQYSQALDRRLRQQEEILDALRRRDEADAEARNHRPAQGMAAELSVTDGARR